MELVEEEEAQVEIDLSQWRVLVVDDVAVNRVVVVRHLQRLGGQVEEAVDGRQALDKFQAGRYDLVLMDLQMPQMDGYEASRQMRQQEQAMDGEERTPILALTASVMEGVTEQCRQAGMDGHLGKPLQMAQLVAEIRRLRSEVQAVEEPQATADRDQRAELEGIPLFEADSLMEIGGLAMVQEIVDLTIETMGPQIRELEAAIEAEDWPQVKRLSHRLKGTWGSSGAQRASAMAARMEDQAKSQALGRIKELYPPLVEIWQQTQTAMRDWLSEVPV